MSDYAKCWLCGDPITSSEDVFEYRVKDSSGKINDVVLHKECAKKSGIDKKDEISESSNILESSDLSFNLKKISYIFYAVAVLFTIIGFVVMYHYGNEYESDFGHVVGGDAYNFIIIGIRGIGFIITGLISCVIGSTLLIYNALNIKLSGDTIE